MSINRVVIASAAMVGALCLGYGASANPIALGQAAKAADAKPVLKVADDGDSSARRYYRRKSQYWREGYWRRRRDAGPPYDSCYMKCIYSSHPADFCQIASYHFCY